MPEGSRPAGKDLKVAIVHDWLVGGGAERVVYELHRMFPEAPIYTSYCTPEWRQRLDGKVVTGWLQHFGRLRKFMALGRIWWFTHLDFSDYDLVISSSGNGEAFGVRTGKNTMHICYCHTPTHYYWRHYDQYLAQPGFGILDPLARFGLQLLVGPLRKWDLRASKRPDYYIANSNHIKNDIKKYYGRDAEVIHPPVDIARFKDGFQGTREGFVAMGRLAPAKRMDIIVQACTELGVPLKIIGDGPDYERLQKLAGPTVQFFNKATGNRVSDQAMPTFLAGAEAFLFASFDDFGISPVEALAAGTPVIAYKAGGALDYVIPGKTGEFYEKQTVESLVEALQKCKPKSYNHEEIQAFAQQFSPETFRKKIQVLITRVLAKKQNS
ncbi:MAG TPA: glycosyltransferase [Candidatus Saccharimonadales bacterium]|nr:glycosyltransferase [Candidatus Saccharimonadales bacterium]